MLHGLFLHPALLELAPMYMGVTWARPHFTHIRPPPARTINLQQINESARSRLVFQEAAESPIQSQPAPDSTRQHQTAPDRPRQPQTTPDNPRQSQIFWQMHSGSHSPRQLQIAVRSHRKPQTTLDSLWWPHWRSWPLSILKMDCEWEVQLVPYKDVPRCNTGSHCGIPSPGSWML
jgi:hypothetical protein